MISFEQSIAAAVAKTGTFLEEEVLQLLTVPQETTHGNFSLPCFALAKKLRKAPKIIAETLATEIELPQGISKVEPINGYLNFFIERSFLATSVLTQIEEKGLNYGHASSNNK
ncbi:MAG TPA: arginine--tRNA ligase, partial [Fibrobacteraceae bacterium]|nr:arginine--tRNA ligase [Fibrobacteraceae bacterium]